jgi:hypothetical protein
MEGVKLTPVTYEIIHVDVKEMVATSPPRNCGSHGHNEDILKQKRDRQYISHLNPLSQEIQLLHLYE